MFINRFLSVAVLALLHCFNLVSGADPDVTYQIYSYPSGKCLTVHGDTPVASLNNAFTDIWTCYDQANQHWTLKNPQTVGSVTWYNFVNGHGKCLTMGVDLAGTDNNTPVVSYDCQSSYPDSQLWKVDYDYGNYGCYWRVLSKGGKCLTVNGNGIVDGTVINVYDCVYSGWSNGNQLWCFWN